MPLLRPSSSGSCAAAKRPRTRPWLRSLSVSSHFRFSSTFKLMPQSISARERRGEARVRPGALGPHSSLLASRDRINPQIRAIRRSSRTPIRGLRRVRDFAVPPDGLPRLVPSLVAVGPLGALRPPRHARCSEPSSPSGRLHDVHRCRPRRPRALHAPSLKRAGPRSRPLPPSCPNSSFVEYL